MLRMAPDHYRAGSDYGGSYGNGTARSARRRTANAIAHRHGLSLVDEWPMPLLGVDCFVMNMPQGVTPASAATLVAHDSGVAWAEPMHLFRPQGTPPAYNDPLFPVQPAASQWHLAGLHRFATGRGVTVAVIDSQVDLRQPDLAGKIAVAVNFVNKRAPVPEQHGTAVAGIIAAKANNRLGIVGLAPDARIMALRACWQAGNGESLCDSLSLAKALHFAIERRSQIVNLSLSGPRDLLLERLIGIGVARGETIVSAVDASSPDGGFPASCEGVIAVSDGNLASRRLGVYIAPGRDVPATEPGGQWDLVNGSSYAAAHVSGLFALLRQRARSAGTGAPALVSAFAGGGAIDPCATLQHFYGACDCNCPTAQAMAGMRR